MFRDAENIFENLLNDLVTFRYCHHSINLLIFIAIFFRVEKNVKYFRFRHIANIFENLFKDWLMFGYCVSSINLFVIIVYFVYRVEFFVLQISGLVQCFGIPKFFFKIYEFKFRRFGRNLA